MYFHVFNTNTYLVSTLVMVLVFVLKRYRSLRWGRRNIGKHQGRGGSSPFGDRIEPCSI